jgi:hypothetical protein
MRYRGKRPSGGLTAGQVVAIAIIAIAAVAVLTTVASARMLHQNPAHELAYCLTTEVEPT